jgi:hypothetical protein
LQFAQAGASDIAKKPAETQTALRKVSPSFIFDSQVVRPTQDKTVNSRVFYGYLKFRKEGPMAFSAKAVT